MKAKDEERANLTDEIRVAQEKLVEAFMAEHGCKPSEAIIELAKATPVQGARSRATWRIRKMTDAERKAQAAQQIERDKNALAKTPEPVVHLPVQSFFGKIFIERFGAVYLSELGARSVAGTTGRVAKVKVRA